MENKSPFLLSSFLFALAFFLVMYSCRKVDNSPGNNNSAINKTEQQFFTAHDTVDLTIKSVQNFVKRQNKRFQFIENLVNRIGIPYWNKSMLFASINMSAEGAQSIQTVYIPFVRDSQQNVNATLVVKMSVKDTAFKILYDWQYASLGFNDTSDTVWNAKNMFQMFSLFDSKIFGRKQFMITDGRIFGGSRKDTMLVTMKLPGDSNRLARENDITVVCVLYVQVLLGFRTNNGLEAMTQTICNVYTGIGGYSGTGPVPDGGGSSGTGWNDPCGAANSTRADGANDCGGTVGWQPTPTVTVSDPCADAKAASQKATDFSKNPAYVTAKNSIQLASTDGKEHAIAFGKNASGTIISSAMANGGDHSVSLESIDNVFADMHNHPRDVPQSSGDLYNFITKAGKNINYGTQYVVTSNGTVYALALINLKDAQTFSTNYPKVPTPPGTNFEPAFPDKIVDEIIDMTQRDGASAEMAMSFILDKYNTGVVLLKQTASGNFSRIITIQNVDANGNKSYIESICP